MYPSLSDSLRKSWNSYKVTSAGEKKTTGSSVT